MIKLKYVYPKLPAEGGIMTPFFRLSGNGLANCLFIYARAIAQAHEHNAKIIAPAWFNICVGPYLRHESDKRHYLGLFGSKGEVSGLNKLLILSFYRCSTEVVSGLNHYFEDFIEDADYVSKYIENHVADGVLAKVYDFDFSNCVAIHIRLGDYLKDFRVSFSWYKSKIEKMQKERNCRFLIFSDGTDEELQELTDMPNVSRAFFGSSIADIFAISKCQYLIGSDSTFSGWGAFLGQIPCVFYRKHYGRVLKDQRLEIVENTENKWF